MGTYWHNIKTLIGKRTYHFLAFAYAALSKLRISLVGQLGVNELLATVFLVSYQSWKTLFRYVPNLKNVTVAYLIFLFSQIASDLVNDSSANNMARGWANIVMAIIVTAFLARLILRANQNVIYYLMGSVVSILIFGDVSIGEVDLAEMGFFKFRLVPALNALLMVGSWYILKKGPTNRINIVVLFIVYGLFNIASDSRSNGIIFISVAMLFYWKHVLPRITLKKIAPYVVGFLLLCQGLYSLYVYQVLEGKIGGEHTRNQITRISNPYNPLNLLMTGRAEVYAGIIAASDRPIFGHGSWAIDKDGKYMLLVYQLHSEEEKYLDRLRNNDKVRIIPSHSVLVGAWMTSGIIGFGALVFIFLLFVKCSFNLITSRYIVASPYFPIVLLFFINGFWTFLFSPLSHIRESLPVMIAFILVLYQKKIYHYKKLARRKHVNEDSRLAGTSGF